jgi:AbrB family looped-hinge helix DNA binding protein
MKTTVSSKGQIVLPAELRQMDRIEPGQVFEVERVDRGEYRLVRRVAAPNDGAIDWLLACPRKDFFVPIDSESTETLSRNGTTEPVAAGSAPTPGLEEGRSGPVPL